MLLVSLPSVCSILHAYIPILTLVLTSTVHPLSTNNSLTELYLSLMRSLYAPFPWLSWFRSRLARNGLWVRLFNT